MNELDILLIICIILIIFIVTHKLFSYYKKKNNKNKLVEGWWGRRGCGQSGCGTCTFPDGVPIGSYHLCLLDGCNPQRFTCEANWDNAFWTETVVVIKNNHIKLNANYFDSKGHPLYDADPDKGWPKHWLDLVGKYVKDIQNIQNLVKTRFWVNPFYILDGVFTFKVIAVELGVETLEYITTMINLMRQIFLEIINGLKTIYSVQQADTLWTKAFELLILIDAQGYNAASAVTGYTFQVSEPFLTEAYALFTLATTLSVIIQMYWNRLNRPTNLVAREVNNFYIYTTSTYSFFGLSVYVDEDSDNSCFHKLRANVRGFGGNEYVENNFKPKDSKVNVPDIPMSVQENAYEKFLYATLKRCHQIYGPQGVNNNPQYVTRIKEMDAARHLLDSSVQRSRAPAEVFKAISSSRSLFFDKTKNAWKPGDSNINYNSCNPITDGQVAKGPTPSTFYSFKSETENAELKNKQLLNIAENLFKSMYGEDVSFEYPWWTTPECPKVRNEDTTNVNEWVRDSAQNNTCISNPLSTYKTEQTIQGQMKPGRIVDGKDIWIENAKRINSNMSNIKTVTGAKNIHTFDNGNLADKWTSLWLAGASQTQNVLQDRDWELSTIKWAKKNTEYDKNTGNFIRETIIPVYQNLASIYIGDSNNQSFPNYRFSIAYESEEKTIRTSLNLLLSPTALLEGIKNITVNDSYPKRKGFLRIFKNMYQYNDYNTSDNMQFGPNKNLANLTTDIFSALYIPFDWDLVELCNDRRDVYIICSINNQFTKTGYDNIYSSNNWFLGKHVYAQFEKCYYAKRRNSSRNSPYGSGKDQLTMKWTIIATNTQDEYRLFNTESKSYLCWGVNYDVQKNFGIGDFLPDGAFDSNRESRTKVLYFVSQDRFYEECSKSTGDCSLLRSDASWKLKSLGYNKYSIIHSTGDQLWYTANLLQVAAPIRQNLNPSIEPLTEELGWVNCSSETSESEQPPEWCAQTDKEKGCYNSEFIIVPVEPTNVSTSFSKSTLANGKLNSGFYNMKLDNKMKWFSQKNADKPYSYADLDSNNQYTGNTNWNQREENKNPFANINDYYDKFQGSFINTLEGGGGDVCSLSNFTHPERNVLPDELYDSNNSWSTAYKNKNFPYNDIGKVTNKTLEQCKAICEKNTNCDGIVYNNNKDCWPKYKMENEYSDNSYDSYKINRSSDNSFTSIGSYKDHSNRAMRNYKGLVSNEEECAKKCTGFQYFGLQDPTGDQSQCFCDNDLDHSQKYGTSDCGKRGGVWCNHIYKQKEGHPEKLISEEEGQHRSNNVQDQSNYVDVHTVIKSPPTDAPLNALGYPFDNGPHNLNIKNYFKAPLQRHNYYCKLNHFVAINIEAYLSNNVDFMNNRTFTTFTNPNVTYLFDLENSENTQTSGFTDWWTKRVAIKVWSTNSKYVEGVSFGLSPYGNYIWWNNLTDPSTIQFYFQSLGEMASKYITLYNYSGTDNFKKDKTTLCHWFDMYRFSSLGYKPPTLDVLYGYTKTIDSSFKEIV